MPKFSRKQNNEIENTEEMKLRLLTEITKKLFKDIENYKPPSKEFLKKWRNEMQEFLKTLKH